jgi:hypothetical protein
MALDSKTIGFDLHGQMIERPIVRLAQLTAYIAIRTEGTAAGKKCVNL